MEMWFWIVVLSITQFVLITYSIYHFEPIYNVFFATSNGKKIISDKFFFQLTNIGYLFTILTLCVYIASYKYEGLRVAYRQMLPLIFVIQIIITALFWILFFKNPSLVVDGKRPSQAWYKHVFYESPKHLIPFLVLFIGVIIEQCPDIDSNKLTMLFTFILYYWGLSEFYAFTRGRYLYGILGRFNIYQRLLMFLLVMIMAIFIYMSLSWLLNQPKFIYYRAVSHYNLYESRSMASANMTSGSLIN
ncbi:uncharacterized protein VICG_00601 [Vittaforma corneae ATCC 50505]|uniref:Uncharacterized protein n=1 Tax=Vittaforma corneae (strain ATCC 50505) TaxID=993615 RepID=L2GQA0_VITCO|nr:uncharacterized protein VICG_00601 [Vittaforma corneae ATCC 50505]ELA42502.1 hypothetical protein VICG_00601 [Vittaforma corneae ATCC 50505]